MEQQNKLFLVIVAAVIVAVAVLFFQPVIREQLAPELRSAWVAIEVEGSGTAEIGAVEMTPGTPFRLHAVLEAEDGGLPLYYTDAAALSIAGEPVPAERLEGWDRGPVTVRWFTIEGEVPYLSLDPGLGVEDFRMREFVRSDWPLAWSVPGEIDAAHDDHLAPAGAISEQRFGTQRYQVRLELYREQDDVVPIRVIRSPGTADLKRELERVATARVTLPGRLAAASRVFGLTQLGVPAGADSQMIERVEELARHDLAYSRLTVLRDHLRAAGKKLGELEWTVVDLAGEARWEDGAVEPGDLLRVGDRLVLVYEDRGESGILDPGDLALDFVQGAAVRELSAIFGTGPDAAVEWASLR